MGWWIFFIILFLLAIMPLGVSILYNEKGPRVRVILGLLKITLFPIPKWLNKLIHREKKPKPPKEKKEEKPKEEPAQPKPKQPMTLERILPLVTLAIDFLGDFRRKLRLNHFDLKVILAGGDPCDLAVNYGRAWAALGNLSSQLERIFVIKERNVEIECDFVGDATKISARLDISITLGRLIGLAVCYGVKALFLLKKGKKSKKNIHTEEKAV